MSGTPQAFQSNVFDNLAFQTGPNAIDPNAFQCSAFQSPGAFQNPSCGVTPPTPTPPPETIVSIAEGQADWIDYGYFISSGGHIRTARPRRKRS
jgi:hypothetical protein